MRNLAVTLAVAALLTSASQAGPHAADGKACACRKLILSQEYIDLTHQKQLTEATTIHEMNLAWKAADICKDKACEAALEQDIASSVHEAYAEYEQMIVRLIADRLTEPQLLAAIAFSKSPTGRAIVAVQSDMSGDFAQINLTFSKRAGEGVYRSFCAQRAEACMRAITESAANLTSH